MARLIEALRQSAMAGAFIPDATMAMCVFVLSLGLTRILGLG